MTPIRMFQCVATADSHAAAEAIADRWAQEYYGDDVDFTLLWTKAIRNVTDDGQRRRQGGYSITFRYREARPPT